MSDRAKAHHAGREPADDQAQPDLVLEHPCEDLPPDEPVLVERRLRLAVLIDAENVAPRMTGWLFRELHRHGEPFIRRVFGNFVGPQLAEWIEVSERFGLEPRHQSAPVSRKNAADIRMVVEAMDLLHAGQAEAFCIVSSDADFAPLATRIRGQGLPVFGFGTINSAVTFRRTCTRFTFLENLHPHTPANDHVNLRKPLRPPSDAVPILRGALANSEDYENWVALEELGRTLSREHVDFDYRTYGCRSLLDLLRKLPKFRIDAPREGIIRVRYGGPKGKRHVPL